MTVERAVRSAPDGRAVAGGALLLVAAATLYGDVFPSWLRDLWNDENYSHGLLVPLVSGYAAWMRRDRLDLFPGGEAGKGGLALAALAMALLVVGKAAGEYFTVRSSFVVLAAGIATILFGRAGLRELRFPLLFLFFMVPIPYILYDGAAVPLKLLSTRAAAAMLSFSGVPVLRDGNMLTLPNIRMEVVDACSGIRSLMSLVAASVVAGHMFGLRAGRQLLLALLAIVLTVSLNSFRLYLTGLLSSWYGSAAAEGFLHSFSGWVTFMGGFVLVTGAAALLRGGRTAP